MNSLRKIFSLIVITLFLSTAYAFGKEEAPAAGKPEKLDVKELILEHLADSYTWHITKIGETDIAIPLPVIVYSQTTGWHVFMSSAFHGTSEYEGLTIASEGKYKGKIVEKDFNENEVKPFDISITKVVFSLLFNSALLIFIILMVARSYKKDTFESKKGFVGFMEMFIMNINDDVIKPCIGKDYRKFSPYLLTVFFFIFLNNLIGIIPIFPGGANVTGNIAITFTLAICTFLIVNIFGTKEYWREIFWPDVPVWLKVPIPLMPAIELVGVFTKPFALMIRLFANMLAGHSIILGLTCLVFVTVSLGPAMNASMTVVSVLFTVFINLVEVLVAYIQAYVFVLLSAVFIGLARVEPHHAHKEVKE
jgi:F-type H+-transporting ATPase subunit a